MNKNSHIILGIFLIIFNIGVVVWEFNHYTNKADKAVRTAYITLAEKLKVNAPNEENCYSNITISVNDDVLRLVNSKYTSDDFEKFLVAHYDAQTFWLNTWMGAIGIILAVVTFLLPMLFMKWHEGKMKEIDRDFKKFGTEKDKLINDLKIAKQETDRSKLEAEKSSFRAKLYSEFNNVDSLINSSRYREALKILEDIEKNDLTNEEKALIVASKGTIAFKLNNIPAAIDLYKKATEMDPLNAMLFNDLGYYYFLNNQVNLAKENYLRAIKINQDIVIFWCNLNDLYVKLGKPDESFKCLKRIIEISPQNSTALNNIGTYMLSFGRINEAEYYYKKSIETDPQNAYLAYANMGYIYNLSNRLDEAIIYITKAIAIRPDVALPYANLAVAYLSKNDSVNAITYLEIFLNKEEIENIYYDASNPILMKIRELIKGFLDRNQTGNDHLIDLIKKAIKKFEDHAMKTKPKENM